jgi:hypothetical protein
MTEAGKFDFGHYQRKILAGTPEEARTAKHELRVIASFLKSNLETTVESLSKEQHRANLRAGKSFGLASFQIICFGASLAGLDFGISAAIMAISPIVAAGVQGASVSFFIYTNKKMFENIKKYNDIKDVILEVEATTPVLLQYIEAILKSESSIPMNQRKYNIKESSIAIPTPYENFIDANVNIPKVTHFSLKEFLNPIQAIPIETESVSLAQAPTPQAQTPPPPPPPKRSQPQLNIPLPGQVNEN